jgi:hypothetical protein
LNSEIQKYLFISCIIERFFKLCIQLNINPKESTMVSKWNLNKIWTYFLLFLAKMISFLNSILNQGHLIVCLACFHPPWFNSYVSSCKRVSTWVKFTRTHELKPFDLTLQTKWMIVFFPNCLMYPRWHPSNVSWLFLTNVWDNFYGFIDCIKNIYIKYWLTHLFSFCKKIKFWRVGLLTCNVPPINR